MYPALNKLTDWISQKGMVSGLDWLPKNWQLQFWLDFKIKGKRQDYIWLHLGEKNGAKSTGF